MNEKNITKKQETALNEVVEMIVESYEAIASNENLANLVKQGDFSNKTFEWLVNRSKIEPRDRQSMDGNERQLKMRARDTIVKAIATITWAHYFMDVFTDEEWNDICPTEVVSRLAYMATLRGGQDATLAIATSMDMGLNEQLEASASGLKAQVSVSLLPSSERMSAIQSELAKRLHARMIEEIGGKLNK